MKRGQKQTLKCFCLATVVTWCGSRDCSMSSCNTLSPVSTVRTANTLPILAAEDWTVDTSSAVFMFTPGTKCCKDKSKYIC